MPSEAQSEQQASAVQSVEKTFDNLKILNDAPLLGDAHNRDYSDAFHHDAYASALYKILLDNQPPLSIGVFGSWGIGKSTVLNLLREKILSTPESKLKYIYFNAWKYSGDSFRRQFLIEVAREVHGKGHDEVRRLEELNFTAVIKRTQEDTFIANLGRAIKDAMNSTYAIKSSGLVRFFVGLAGMLIACGMGYLLSKVSIQFGSIVTAAGVSSVFLWFSKLKFEDLFVIQETPIYDPKLVFPEQFESEFRKLIVALATRSKVAVIAIDDIDRCEAAVIRDVLTATKNFIGDHDCYFVVPCDEKTVVDVFGSSQDQKRGYKDESLRKYFNVSIRISAISSSDLVDFANQIVRRTHLPDEVVQMAILGSCRDARKMKHFINSLSIKYQVAKAREAAKLMPAFVDQNIVGLAKAVLIEDGFPEFYTALMETPRLFALAEKSANETDVDAELLKAVGDSPWWKETWPTLKEVLRKTKEFPMPGEGILFTLKSSSFQAKIVRGVELESAIIEGDFPRLTEIVSEIQDTEQKAAVADLIADRLRIAKAIFLQNSIAAALYVESIAGFVPDPRHQQVGGKAVSILGEDQTQRVLVQDARRLVLVANLYKLSSRPVLLSKYCDELGKLDADNIFIAALPDLIETLYSVESWRDRVGSVINDRLVKWAETVIGLEAVAKIRMPADASPDVRIPSEDIVFKISVSKMAVPFDEADVIRRDIAFSYWTNKLAQPLLAYLNNLLIASDKVTYTREVEFVLDSLCKHPQMLLEEDSKAPLWNSIKTLFSSMSDSVAKRDALHCIALYALYGYTPPIKAEAATLLKNFMSTMTDEDIREGLRFLSQLDIDTEPLRKEIVEQEFGLLQNEISTASERSRQRLELCVENREWIAPSKIESIILAGLGQAGDVVFMVWVDQAAKNLGRLSQAFPKTVCDKCLELISSSPAPNRLESLYALFGTSLVSVDPPEDASLLKRFSDKLVSDDPNIRDKAVDSFEAVVTAKESLKAYADMQVERMLFSISQMLDTQLSGMIRVLPVLLAHPSRLNSRARDLSFQIAKRLLQNERSDVREFGFAIVERSETIQSVEISDIAHLAINLGWANELNRDRVESVLKKLEAHVDEAARRKIVEFIESTTRD